MARKSTVVGIGIHLGDAWPEVYVCRQCPGRDEVKVKSYKDSADRRVRLANVARKLYVHQAWPTWAWYDGWQTCRPSL